MQSSAHPQHVQSPASWQPIAHFTAAASSTTPNPWLLDSDATHHISSDLANLSLHQPYTSGEEVVIGDGKGLSITHTGSTYLHSTLQSLSLTDVLYVPDITKNFISVYRLCNINRVSVEFFRLSFR